MPVLDLDSLVLDEGGHSGPDHGFCVMEAVAYINGEPWSDHPQCVCPVIASFLRSWNDGIKSAEDRSRLLKPLIPLVTGTRSTAAVETIRKDIILDWLVRTAAPMSLDLNEPTKSHAETLRALPVLTAENISEHAEVIQAARDAARDAAWDAARAAAGDAARDAARAAAGEKLKATVEQSQQSATELVKRLCAVTAA